MYLAINDSAYKFWAVKVLTKDENTRTGNELELWKHFSHPNLPDVVDVIEDEHFIMIVMDYIEGRSLAEVLMESQTAAMTQAIYWGIQICQVLNYLHLQKPPIIYGDLKPANLICRPDKSLVLVDFGSLKTQENQGSLQESCRGTKGYAAPEQGIPEFAADIRVDLYCLGATLFQMVTGELPKGTQKKEVLQKHRIPRELQKIILKCLQFDPNRRYTSCEECRLALDKFLYSRRLRRLLAAAAMLITISAAIIFVDDHKVQVIKAEKEQSYETYLEEAKYNIYSEQIKLCQKAIFLNPVREEAYQQLIQILLSDSSLSEEEDIFLRKVLREKSGGRQVTNEEALMSNEKGCGESCYQLGMAYWYYFEGNGGKAFAAKWFQIAATEGEGEEQNSRHKSRAVVMARIGSYYDAIRSRNDTGEDSISYLDYWKDLMELYKMGDEGEEQGENLNTMLLLWDEITGQVCNLTERFLLAGINEKELTSVVSEIEEYMKEVDENIKTKAELEMKKSILENVKIAKESVKRTSRSFRKGQGSR